MLPRSLELIIHALDSQADLYEASKQPDRFMNSHFDLMDFLNEMRFFDGVSAIISRSSGGASGQRGSLRLLALPPSEDPPPGESEHQKLQRLSDRRYMNSGGKNSGGNRKLVTNRSPMQFMACLMNVDLSSAPPSSLIKIPAPLKGKVLFTRAKTQCHGADSAEWRDVGIFYKNQYVAYFLQLIFDALPILCQEIPGSNVDRLASIEILKMFVLAHVGLEIPELREQGLWKPSKSKHSGDRVYRSLDASWDVKRFENGSDDLKQFLSNVRTAAEGVRSKGVNHMFAMAMHMMVVRVAKQTIAARLCASSHEQD